MALMASPWRHPKTHVYYIRRAVPDEIRAALGRREYKRSLRTKNLGEAKLRFAEAFAESERAFEAARVSAASPAIEDLSAKEAAELAGEWLRANVDNIATGDGDPEEIWAGLSDTMDALDAGKVNGVTAEVDVLIQDKGLSIERQSAAYAQLAEHVGRAVVTALGLAYRRAQGDWGGEQEALAAFPQPTGNRGATVTPAARDGGGPLVSEVVALVTREEGASPRRELEIAGALRRLYANVGDVPVGEVTKADLRDLKDAMVAEGLSPATVNKQLSLLRLPFAYAVTNGYIAENPGAGLNVRGARKRAQRRQTHTTADLNKLFSGPVHAAGERPKGGGGEAAYWLPLIALYHGMRMREIGQLAVSDLKEEEGIWYFNVTDEGDGKSLKTEASRRKVPLHPVVIELGLLEYAEALPRAGRLFPDLKADKLGNPVKSFGQWYSRYARGLGISEPGKVFHSFRHDFKDACRAAGISEEVHDALTGHAGASVGRRYGDQGVPLELRARAVAQLQYAGLGIRRVTRSR